VADPRIVPQAGNDGMHHGKYRVEPWTEPAHTVIGATRVGSGASSVADPRVRVAYDHGYGVLRWDEPSSTIAGGSAVGQGAYSVADVRFGATYHNGTYGVMGWEEASGTITGNGRPGSVADPRKPPEHIQVIVAADGTWHRPITILEKAALQDLPTIVDGKPLQLAGTSQSGWAERIGNAVPVGAARAIAEQMLTSLIVADAGTLLLSTAGPVWVTPPSAEALS
jgi:site-specific DNA-cytosine methylase